MTPEPTPNADLIRRTMAAIREQPERWDQVDFFVENSCGTAFCFGGWALALTRGDDWYETYPFGSHWDEAQAALCLTDGQAAEVFSPTADRGGVDAFESLVTEVTGVTFGGEA